MVNRTRNNGSGRPGGSQQASRRPAGQQPHQKPRHPVLMWVLFTFVFMGAFGFFPHLSFWLLLPCAALLLPVRPWQNILSGFLPGKLKIIVTLILFLLGTVLSPQPEVEEQPEPEPTVIVTEAPTTEPTQVPTTEPTQIPTTEPTQAPATEPTQAPTEAPTETAAAIPTEAETEAPTQAAPAEYDYVKSTNSQKFHTPSCRHAQRIKDANRQEFHCTREEMISKGFVPCGTCNP